MLLFGMPDIRIGTDVNVFRCLKNDKEENVNYLRAVFIGAAIGGFLIILAVMAGCKNVHRHNQTIIQDPPPVSTLECVVEENGATVVTVQTAGYEGLILAEAEETEQLQNLVGDQTIHLDLDPGEHTIQLLAADGSILAFCVVSVLVVDGDKDGDEGDGFEVPPRPSRCGVRFYVCHHGKTLRLPWAALEAHSKHVGDHLGKCEE
jgi:hypothetical protein